MSHVFGHQAELTIPGGGTPTGGSGALVHVELSSEFGALAPISDPDFGGTGPGLTQGRPVTTTQDVAYGPFQSVEAILGFTPGATPAQQAGLAEANRYIEAIYNAGLPIDAPGVQQAFSDGVRRSTATLTASINPLGQGASASVSGVFPTEEIVPNVGGYFSQAGGALGGLLSDIFQTDQSWDQWGAGFGTIADILSVVGVIPGGGAGHGGPQGGYYPPQPTLGGTPPFLPGPTTTQYPTLAQPWPTQPQQPPRGLPMPHIPTSIPVAFPGGAPVQQAAFPMQITPGGGGGQIRPSAHCSTSLPSRVDIPTVDSRGNTRFTTFKNMGRPLLWSGDLAASKRVRKVAAKARRAKGR